MNARRLRAGDLPGWPLGYQLREAGEADGAWRRVDTPPVRALTPQDSEFMPELVTVTFTDDTVRIFNPEDQVEIRY